jgi:hypothetical protein
MPAAKASRMAQASVTKSPRCELRPRSRSAVKPEISGLGDPVPVIQKLLTPRNSMARSEQCCCRHIEYRPDWNNQNVLA